MIRRCRQCGGAVELKTLERLAAADAPLELAVTGMPAAECAKGHRAPVDQDFMLWLIHALKEREPSLPAGEEKGMLLFKKYYCRECHKALASQSERRQAFPFELAYEGYAPFHAEIEMPLYRCTGCGREQIRCLKEARRHTSQAIAALNDAARFPHSA